MGTALKVTTFQQRFSDLFEESEKTIMTLAKELHVSNQTVSAWKTGARSPKEPTIIAIAKHFGVSVEWLMGFDVDKEQPKEQDRKIVIPDSELFKKITEHMSYDDYQTVMAIYSKTYERMKEEGLI